MVDENQTTDPNQNPFDPLTQGAEQNKNTVGELTNKYFEMFKNISMWATNSSEDLHKVAGALSSNTQQLNNFTDGLLTIKSLTTNMDIFGNLGQPLAQFGLIDRALTEIGANIKGISNLIPEWAQNLAATGTQGQKIEAEFLGMMAASGRLNEVFGETGNLTGDLGTKTLKYAESLFNAADANGMLVSQVAQYSSQLGRIPGILTQNVDAGDKFGSNLSALTASLKVLSGSGQDIRTMLDTMTKAYEDLGNAQGTVEDNAQKGLNLFAQMVTLSQDLNLRFADTKNFLEGIANQFKYVGDNTDAASQVLERYIGALERTGLTGRASMDIIQDLMKGVQGLDMAQRAYLSAQTGGPGGLQGAVQIEQMMRQGNTAQVVQMMEQTLRQQFGGRIVTQAEAATNQTSAADFTRQRTMLMQGPFGQLFGTGVQGEEKATRMLEALAQGDRGLAGKQIDPLQRVAEQGNSIQEKQTTILTQIANSTERMAVSSQLAAVNILQSGLGRAAGTENMMREGRAQDQQQDGARTLRDFGTPLDLETLKANLARQLFSGMTENAENLKTGMGNLGAEGASLINREKSALSQTTTLLENERNFRNLERNISARGPTTIPNQPATPILSPNITSPIIPAPRLTMPTAATHQAIATAQQTPTKIENHILIELAPGVEDKFKITSTTPTARVVNTTAPTRSTSNANADGTPHLHTNEPGY